MALEVLWEYEKQRKKIIDRYYARLEEIVFEINKYNVKCQQEMENIKDEYQQKAAYAQKLAEVASRFYENAQRMLQKPHF